MAAILILFVAACASNSNLDPTPPPIHYGEDVCELCGMIISEEAYAAAYITSDGHGHVFDDIGDMFKARREMQEDVRAFFVHDYQSKDWIRAETAHYVRSNHLSTPMLSGLAAFASPEKGRDFAAEQGALVLTFDELLNQYQQN